MIRGFFRPLGYGRLPWAVLNVEVTLSRFGIVRSIQFVIDTGMDYTVIGPRPAEILLPSGTQLVHRYPFQSLGSSPVLYASEPAELTFTDTEGGAMAFTLPVFIAQEGHGDPDMPSLLGRDVLFRFRLVIDHQAGEVSLM